MKCKLCGKLSGISRVCIVCRTAMTQPLDPTLVPWQYSQSTGQLTHDGELIATGYSGHSTGLNSPSMQSVHNLGPTPQGLWRIGPQQDHTSVTGHSLPLSMRLTPEPGTETFGRSGFLIHGDNTKGDHSASQGCIILPRAVRSLMAGSMLLVTP